FRASAPCATEFSRAAEFLEFSRPPGDCVGRGPGTLLCSLAKTWANMTRAGTSLSSRQRSRFRAFSSKVETGSRQENASNQGIQDPRFEAEKGLERRRAGWRGYEVR